MAKKGKRPQPKKPQRSGQPARRNPPAFPPVTPADSASAGLPPPAAATPARAIPRPAPRRVAAAALPPQDARIPLDRVPYFRSDLRRIAVTAGLMFVLLIAGSIVLRKLLLA
jgi:hypothetical protein